MPSDVTPFTIRAILREDKKNSKGLCPISICITIGGKRSYQTTGLRVLPEQWEAGRVIGIMNAAHYNTKILKKLGEYEAKLLTSEVTDIEAAKHLIGSQGDRASFIEYATRVLPDLDIAPNTLRRWGYDLAHIKNYAPDLSFGQITPAWLTAFNKHLTTMRYPDKKNGQPGNIRMTQNSARKTFVFLRRIFNEAKANGMTRLYPFRDWTLPGEVRKEQLYLTLEETDKIAELLARPLPAPLLSTIAHFLLECYSGIRHSDWNKWTVERLVSGESLKLTTTKTSEPIYLPLGNSPRLAAIVAFIRDNKLEYVYTNQDANRQLKTVALLAGLDKHITTHTGRHSAATMLLQKGFSRETVAQVLGVSMKVIDIYAKMTRQKVRTEFESLGGL